MSTTIEKARCSRCKEVIFTSSDAFLPDPFSPPSYTNVPLRDSYADGHHLGGCDVSIASQIPQKLFNMKADMLAEGKSREAVEQELARRKTAWLGN